MGTQQNLFVRQDLTYQKLRWVFLKLKVSNRMLNPGSFELIKNDRLTIKKDFGATYPAFEKASTDFFQFFWVRDYGFSVESVRLFHSFSCLMSTTVELLALKVSVRTLEYWYWTFRKNFKIFYHLWSSEMDSKGNLSVFLVQSFDFFDFFLKRL